MKTSIINIQDNETLKKVVRFYCLYSERYNESSRVSNVELCDEHGFNSDEDATHVSYNVSWKNNPEQVGFNGTLERMTSLGLISLFIACNYKAFYEFMGK